MVRAFEVDETTGDLKITDANINVVEDQYAVAQRLRAKLNTHLGEWILDTTFGVPYLQSIFGPNPNRSLIASVMIAVITETPGVIAVTDYTIEIDFLTRNMTMDFTVTTTFGVITVTVEPLDRLSLMIITIIGPAGPFIG